MTTLDYKERDRIIFNSAGSKGSFSHDRPREAGISYSALQELVDKSFTEEMAYFTDGSPFVKDFLRDFNDMQNDVTIGVFAESPDMPGSHIDIIWVDFNIADNDFEKLERFINSIWNGYSSALTLRHEGNKIHIHIEW